MKIAMLRCEYIFRGLPEAQPGPPRTSQMKSISTTVYSFHTTFYCCKALHLKSLLEIHQVIKFSVMLPLILTQLTASITVIERHVDEIPKFTSSTTR